MAVAAGAEHDNLRVHLFQPFVVQSHLVHDAGRETLGDDVRPGHQLFKDIDSLRVFEVQADIVLRGGVGDGEEGAALQPHRLALFIGGGEGGKEPDGVRPGGGLYAYRHGAVVAQVIAGINAHPRPAELYQFHAFKRSLDHFYKTLPV